MNLADVAAAEVGMDPTEFRELNFIEKDQFPYLSPTGFVYDAWYRLGIELTASSYEFTVTAPDSSTVWNSRAISM